MSNRRIRGSRTLIITVVIIVGRLLQEQFLIIGGLVALIDSLKTAVSFVFVFGTCFGSMRGRSANTTQFSLQGTPRQIETAEGEGRFQGLIVVFLTFESDISERSRHVRFESFWNDT